MGNLTIKQYKCEDFSSFDALFGAFFSDLPDPKPKIGALAVGAPVKGDVIQFTNLTWQLSIQGLKNSLGLDDLFIINTAEATAKSLPFLNANDRLQVGPIRQDLTSIANDPKAILNVGTSLECSGLVPYAWQQQVHWIPVISEVGHMAVSSQNQIQSDLVQRLKQTFGHVSYDLVSSSVGLRNIYASLFTKENISLEPFIDIDEQDGDILPEGSKAYPSEMRYQKFEGLDNISFDEPEPKPKAPPLIDAIIPKTTLSSTALSDFGNVSSEQIGLMALKAQNLQPSMPFDASIKLPENCPPKILKIADQSLQLVFQFLGGIAGEVALAFGATGGIYLTGDMLVKLQSVLMGSSFRTMFQAKGKMSSYLANIPTYLILHPAPALVGLTRFVWEKTQEQENS